MQKWANDDEVTTLIASRARPTAALVVLIALVLPACSGGGDHNEESRYGDAQGYDVDHPNQDDTNHLIAYSGDVGVVQLARRPDGMRAATDEVVCISSDAAAEPDESLLQFLDVCA